MRDDDERKSPETGAATPLDACPQCGCRDLFIRRDFPQKLGVTIVVVAGLAFLILARWPHTFVWGVVVLVAATLADVALVLFVPKVTVCYRCRAEFRGVPLNPKHSDFELAVAEKYRSGGGGGGEPAAR